MISKFTASLALCPSIFLFGCTTGIAPVSEKSAPYQNTSQQQFFDRLTALCGKAFPGGLISSDSVDADMSDKAMVMHVAQCSDREIKVPFHIETEPGKWDRSRTWVITKTGDETRNVLRLKHDHRHEDGEPDDITMYGGDTADSGTATRQSFPVDAESIAMFKTGGLTASVTNIWAIEVDADSYTYALSRANRDFRVRFDLTQPIAPPPLPWGWEKPE